MSETNDINSDIIWKIIHSYFDENPQSLVTHHLESYNDFYANGIQQIFKEKNPIRLSSKYDETINDYRYQCMLYIGGKDGSRIYFGKPVIHDTDNAHYMFPNEARMRNMTYGMTIHYDIEVLISDMCGGLELNITIFHLAEHFEYLSYRTKPTICWNDTEKKL